MRIRPAAWLWAILLATLVVYWPALGNGFAQDDCHLVQVAGNENRPNPMVETWQGVTRYFASHYWAGIDAGGDLYRPLTILGFALTHATFGDSAFPHHALNVLLHLAAVALVWGLLGTLGCGTPARSIGTAVFALHAARSEVVASIVGRSELLAFDLGAAALLVHLGPRSALRAVGTGVLLLLAFCSKESALAWPGIFACVEVARGARVGPALRRALLHGAVPVAAFLLLRHAALSGLPPGQPVLPVVNPLVQLEAPARIATALCVQACALGKTVWPQGLCYDYGIATFTLRPGFSDPAVLVALALHVALLATMLACVRRKPLVFLAIAVWYGAALITSNVPFPTGVVFAERLLYTPALGLSLAAAALVVGWRTALPFVLWLVPTTVELAVRVPRWHDDSTLFLADVERNPRSLRVRCNAAKALRDQGLERVPEAIRHLEAATAIEPEFAQAWNNLAAMLLDAERIPEAEQALARAAGARMRIPREDDRLHSGNLGAVYLRTSRVAQAVPLLLRALELDANWGSAWVDAISAAEALGWIERGEELPARRPLWEYLVGMHLVASSRAAEAEAHFASAFRHEPRFGRALLGMAGALEAQGKRAEAARALDALAGDAKAPAAIRQRARDEAARIRRM